MLVFISYPRELKEAAAKLEVELRNRKFDTFLDVEEINLTDIWRVKIEEHINKASVFVILYDPNAANQKRFFLVELERIKKEREKNVKKIITVIFPPTKKTDLPPYLKCYQVVEAITNGHTDGGNDNYWTDKVIQEIERLRNIQKDGVKQRLKVILPITAIITFAGIVMAALIYPPAKLPSNTPVISKATCESLLGNYQLLGSYVYLEEHDIRATSVDGSWKAHSCKSAGKEGSYVLEGDDTTVHRIEIKIQNTYEHVANAINKGSSKITIGKDGRLADRRLLFPVDGKPETTGRELNGKIWRDNTNYIRIKLEEYADLIREKHRIAQRTMRCTSTLGKNENGQDVIASICPGYIRVMEKDR